MTEKKRGTPAASHTLGPWEMEGFSPSRGKALIQKTVDKKTRTIAEVSGLWGDLTQATANARLIAAAPDAVAELREVVSLLAQLTSHHPNGGMNKMLCKRIDAINVVFAKAEGRE